jgi:hypothetical protein
VNQEAIGQATVSFLGPDNGLRLTKLLREHVRIASQAVSAIKNDPTKLVFVQQEWTANANAIATLLNKANSRWPQKTLAEALQRHLDLTTKEISARVNKDWSGDIAAFDGDFDQVMKFADFLANGMVAMVESVAAKGSK